MEGFLALSELYLYGVGLILSGFILSFIPMMIGYVIDGLSKIFKNL